MKIHSRTKRLFPLFVLISLAAFTSCEKYADGPEIGWLTGSSLTYSYSRGALSGFTANLKFAVTYGNSGEIKMTAEHAGDQKSCVAFVEPGEEYTATVQCAISKDGETGSIIVSSPTASEPFTVDI